MIIMRIHPFKPAVKNISLDLPGVIYFTSSKTVYNYDLRQGAHPTLQGILPDQEKLSIRTAQIKSRPIPLLFFHLNKSHRK